MEPLTHTLVGAAIARTRLGRDVVAATPMAMVAANLPDLDVLAYLGGSDQAMGFRRGWTHGPPAMVLLPALLLAVFHVWSRRGGGAGMNRRLAGIVVLAACTHPALDWLNNYGIRLLMPFDGTWFYGDAVFIVDPWLWMLLGLAVFVGGRGLRLGCGVGLAMACSLVAILANRGLPENVLALWFVLLGVVGLCHWRARAKRGEEVAVIGLALAGVYLSGLILLSAAGSFWVANHLEGEGFELEALMVGPKPANPLSWDVIAQTPSSYRSGTLSWGPFPRLVLDPGEIPRVSSQVERAAMADPAIAGIVGWFRFPYAQVDDAGALVYFADLRYVRPPIPSARGFSRVVVQRPGH